MATVCIQIFLAGKVINEDIPDIIWEEDCLVWLVAVMWILIETEEIRKGQCFWRNGNPVQSSCLENRKERGDWHAADHGVTESDRTERLYWTYP